MQAFRVYRIATLGKGRRKIMKTILDIVIKLPVGCNASPLNQTEGIVARWNVFGFCFWVLQIFNRLYQIKVWIFEVLDNSQTRYSRAEDVNILIAKPFKFSISLVCFTNGTLLSVFNLPLHSSIVNILQEISCAIDIRTVPLKFNPFGWRLRVFRWKDFTI